MGLVVSDNSQNLSIAGKRLFTFDHYFGLGFNNDLNFNVPVNQNSYFRINRINAKFNHVKDNSATVKYYTDSNKFSGKFILSILETETGSIKNSYYVPIHKDHNIFEESVILDTDNLTGNYLTFQVLNDINFSAFADGLTNIALSYTELNMFFTIEIKDYPKNYYELLDSGTIRKKIKNNN